ncbi:MAG: hypothetical protein AAB288_01180, partial [Acidobacteriota bacterium]
AIALCESQKTASDEQWCYDHVFENMGMSAEKVRDVCTSRDSERCLRAFESFNARGLSSLISGSDE